VVIPAGTPPGSHVIRLTQGDTYELTSGSFDVTRPAGPCLGDCNQDRRVDVSEVVTAIGIALDRLDPSDCLGLDSLVDGLTIADIVAAVRNTLEGCPAFLDLQSFGGAYDVLVGSVNELAYPAGVSIHPGEISVRDGELFLAFEYFPGLFEVGGVVAEDGSVALEGVFEQDGAEPVAATGRVLLNQSESGEWIGGELVFHPSNPVESLTLRFLMQR
jgi:hypothetical protein